MTDRVRGTLGGAFTAIAVVAGLLIGTAGHADPHDDKTRVDRQLAQTQATLEAATDRARQATGELAAATAALPGAEAALADARGRVIGAEVAARQADRDAQAARAVERAATGEYEQAVDAVEQGRVAVSGFVTAAYMGSGFLVVNSILNSGGPSGLATQLGYLDHIAASQQRALDAITAARMVAKQRADVALLARQSADRAAEAARLAHEAALTAQTAAEAAATEVRNLIAQKERAIVVANEERTAVLARYEQLKADSERIAGELRGFSARRRGGGAPGPQLHPGAYFLMPVQGWKSSDFGMRFDPYYEVWQLHAGVDIAAGGGQPIYAGADGTVVRADWAGGYGRYTCVYHGEYQNKGGLATCYAHQSQFLVSVGQFVRRGAILGRVGSTGAATGNHLHFEVRLDGNPVNPLNWLPGCLC